MNSDDAEIADYLRSLLDHGRKCHREECPACRTLHGIFEVIRKRLFTSPVYPEVLAAAASVAARR